MAKIFDNILGTIGDTPVVKITKLAPKGINMYVKIEAFNPMGSVKDRLALGIIEAAETDGSIQPGQTVVEASSGNTGIGLAMVCAQKGYPLVVTMAESFSVERRKLMRYLGAKVILTPAPMKGTGMYNKAVELAEKHGWFLARQFENDANPQIHAKTTAREILDAFEGQSLDYWVTGYGTGGTLKGVAGVLRKESPKTRIVVTEPKNAALLESGVPQEADESGVPTASHPVFEPHPMQGWTPDFISKITVDAVETSSFDEILPVPGPEAIAQAQNLARQEGIFVGISAGGTFAAALKVAENAPEGSNILCMLPDTGERYLSTPLFEGIEAEMSEEEIGFSQSTPSCQFEQ
jgi:cysteine synthase A